MSDSSPKIAVVKEENHGEHVERWQRHRLRKAFLKAKDRRKNFEKGEFAGFCYWMGLSLIVVAASGEAMNQELVLWQQLLIGLGGGLGLATKTYIKRRFWKETEDAEYKDEDDD